MGHLAATFNEMKQSMKGQMDLLREKGEMERQLRIKETEALELQNRIDAGKLQLLSLLSGGEKTLTAIAILFATLKLKPTPFCILDEIEAALDDANIGYFADYLSEYSKSTQFVVITHRKGTMERANGLYGVAMEEQGVSRMVSVSLQDYSE